MLALPEELLNAIVQYLPLRDVLHLRQVSQHFRAITSSRDLWNQLLRREIQVERRIPVPGSKDSSTLSAVELEDCVRRSLSLHRNWSSASPMTTRKTSAFATGSHSAPSIRVISLDFVDLDAHSYLLSVCLNQSSTPRSLLFELWEIGSGDDGLRCVARKEVRWRGGYAVNKNASAGSGILALKTNNIEILGVDRSRDPEQAFITLKTLATQVKSVLSFIRTTLVVLSESGEVKILDTTRTAGEVELRHPQPPLPANQPSIFETLIENDYAILIRPTTLELYNLDRFRKAENVQFLSPVIVHNFPWRLDSCRIERDTKHAYVSKPSQPAPINILLRFSSLFPWPVNLLQHYILHPNRLYAPSAIMDLDNLPYHFPPVLQQTISSPIRLFAVSDIALGSYGTAVWVDSHTEEYFLQGEMGQRLAGLMLSPKPDGEESEDETEPPEFTDKSTQSQASSIFDVQEADDWTRVAVDESEGRIAVGSVTGRIVLYDYA
ncbi:hypothetical protein V5O48_006399 [Marasmius crinis-equi]|uniref:F-box domain-containing protein n=1 Tax=Marasmius crinis-equi TaxID=585013 RepID=A0ABR3FK62_9AGAR